MSWLPGGSGGYYGGTSSPFWTGGPFNPTNPITIIPGVDFNFGMLSPYGNYGNALQQGLQLDAYVRWLLSPEGNKTYFEKEVYPAIIDMLLRTEGQDAADKYKEYIDFLNAGGNPEDWNPDGDGDNSGTDDGGGDDPPPPSEPTGATGISIEGCGFGEVSYEPTDELGTVYEAVTCAPISEFCALFSNFCTEDGKIIGVTDGDDDGNNGNGLDDDFDINCNLINKQDGDEPGTCGPCLPGYKLDNTKLSPFEGITPCVKIEERKEEDPNCVEQNRETEDNGFCGNCKPGFSPDLREGSATHDQCIPNNITLGTDDDDDDDIDNDNDDDNTDVDNDDDTNVDNDDDTNVDNDDDVDDVDDVDDDDNDDDDDTDTTFDCASVGKAPLWAGSLPTSEAGCGPCLPTHDTNEDGSCSPKVNGGDNGTDPGIDPGLGTVAGAGIGSITGRMFEKYIPDLDYTPTEILGKAGPFGSLKVEGLLKDYFA